MVRPILIMFVLVFVAACASKDVAAPQPADYLTLQNKLSLIALTIEQRNAIVEGIDFTNSKTIEEGAGKVKVVVAYDVQIDGSKHKKVLSAQVDLMPESQIKGAWKFLPRAVSEVNKGEAIDALRLERGNRIDEFWSTQLIEIDGKKVARPD